MNSMNICFIYFDVIEWWRLDYKQKINHSDIYVHRTFVIMSLIRSFQIKIPRCQWSTRCDVTTTGGYFLVIRRV